jgi:hypothetical protein
MPATRPHPVWRVLLLVAAADGAVDDIVFAGGVLHVVLLGNEATAPPGASALYRAAILRLQAEASELEAAPGIGAAPVSSRRSYFGNGLAARPAAGRANV